MTLKKYFDVSAALLSFGMEMAAIFWLCFTKFLYFAKFPYSSMQGWVNCAEDCSN